jgi:two-component system, NarL family, sensor histidine kinase UhpB
VAAALALNLMLVLRRFAPLEKLVEDMEKVDLSRPGPVLPSSTDGIAETEEVARLELAFLRMMRRLEAERRRAGSAALRAQEQERARLARDLHDEVNQALTGVLLRLEALREEAPSELEPALTATKGLANQAMLELLSLARQLRPTALDDHGLIAALASQVSDFGQRTGVHARFSHTGQIPQLSDEEQLVIFRVTQESLSNIAKHARATDVSVELSFVGRTLLRVRDDGGGFDRSAVKRVNGRPRGRAGGLGLSGMRERALLVGGSLDVFTAPGAGTTIELTMGVT